VAPGGLVFGEEKNLWLLPVIELRIAQATAACASRLTSLTAFRALMHFECAASKTLRERQQRFPWTKLRHLL